MADFHEEFKTSIVVDTSQLQEKTEQALRRLEGFKRTAAESGKVQLRIQIAQFEKGIDDARRRLSQFKKEGNTLGQLEARIEIKQLQDAKGIASKSLRDLSLDVENTKKSFFGMNSVVKDSIKAFAGFVVVQKFGQALRESFDAAVGFESAFTGIVKTLDATDAEFAQLSAEFRELAKVIPVPVEGLAKIGELAGQLGVKKNDIVGFTKSIAAIATSTNLTEEAAATSFARIANIFQAPIAQVENLGSAIVALGNNFATTESEILNFAERIAGSGQLVGLTQADIAGIAAAFTSVGIEAEAGGTAVQKTLLTINNAVVDGGAELAKFASVSGQSAQEFAALWRSSPAKAFELFVKGLASSGDQAANVLEEIVAGDVRLQRAFLSVAGAGDLLTNAIGTANGAFAENTALLTEAERRYATTESQLQLQKARWNDLKIAVGNFLIKVALPVGEFFIDLAEAIGGATNQFSPFLKIAKAAGAALSTAFSVKFLLGIAGGFEKLTSKIQTFGVASTAAAAATSTAGKALAGLRGIYAALLNPIVGASLALTALALTVFKARGEAEEYTNSVDSLKESLAGLAEISAGTASRTDGFAKALDEAVAASAKFAEISKAGIGGANSAGPSAPQFSASFAESEAAIVSLRGETERLLSSFGVTDAEIKKITDDLVFFQNTVRPSAEDMATLNEAVEKAAPRFKRLSSQFNRLVSDFQASGLSLTESAKKAVEELDDGWQEAGHDVEDFTKAMNGTLVSAAAETDGIGAAYSLGFALGFSREEVQALEAVQNLSGESLGILLAGAVQAEDRGGVFGLLWALGISEQDAKAASAAEDLTGAVQSTLIANEAGIRAAGYRSGIGAIQGILDGIAQRFPALQKAANAVAKALGSISAAGGSKFVKLGLDVGKTLFGVTDKANDVTKAFNEANASIKAAASSGGGFSPSGGGGGGGASKALAEAEKKAEEAEKAVNDFQKALADSSDQAKKLRDNVKSFYQDIVDSIAEATQKQAALNQEFTDFSVAKTQDFAVGAGQRDAELAAETLELEEELAAVKAENVESTEDEIEQKEKIKELEEGILAVAKERAEIQSFLDSLAKEGSQASLDAVAAFDEAKRRSTLSEFEQNRLALEDSIKAKEEEIKAEIAKQQRIIEIQKQFLAIQEAADNENIEKKKRLNALATGEEVVSAEERSKILGELGFEDLTQAEELDLLKQAATANSLDAELEAIKLQQDEILATKQEYIDLAEQAQLQSIDVIQARTEELIEVIKRAQQEQMRLNQLAGAASASQASSSSQNVNITNFNSGNVDIEAAMNSAVNKIK